MNETLPTYERLLRQQHQQQLRVAALGSITCLVILVACYVTGLLDPGRLAEGLPAGAKLVQEMLPPDFRNAANWLRPLFDTLGMSVAGTAIAIVFSLPLSLLAARNTTPHMALYHLTRLLLNILRSIPELIMGIVFVAAVGFGSLPGVLAVGFHSVGMVGKFFAEYIEHVDQAPIEAAQAAGATPVQVIYHALLPQVWPKMVDLVLYRWEFNFRASTVMGAVGAGGIGLELIGALRILSYQEVSALLIVILAMVTLVDGFSGFLRKRLT